MACTSQKRCEFKPDRCGYIRGPYYIYYTVSGCGPGETILVPSPKCSYNCTG